MQSAEKKEKQANLLKPIQLTMRVLFYTAAAVAATIASIGQAVKLETSAAEYFADFDD